MKEKLAFSLFVFLISIPFLVNAYAQNDSETPSNTWANFPLFQSPEQFIQELTSDFFRGTSIWDLIAYTAGMVLYSFFVWKFYRFVSRREIIPINIEKYSSKGTRSPFKIGAYIASYVLLFPFFLFLWFFVYSFFIYFLARESLQ